MLWVQTHYVLLWCQGLRVDFISCASLTSVRAVYAWAPIMSCFLLLVIILLPYGYFWDFFFSIVPPYVQETHTTSRNALTLFPCTRHPALLHGQMHSTPNTKHSAQQHLVQDLTHNQPGGKTAGVVWLGESGGWEDGLHWHSVQGNVSLASAQTCRLRSSVACVFLVCLFVLRWHTWAYLEWCACIHVSGLKDEDAETP